MISVAKDVNKVEPLYTDGGDVNGATTLENSLAVPQMVTQSITIYPCHSTPQYIQYVKISSYKKTHTQMFIAVLLLTAKRWRQPKCLINL